MQIESQIDYILKSINGKRRTRLLNRDDIIRLISECLQDDSSTTGGGTVANKYGYPSYQTVACSTKKNNNIYVGVGVKSANKGSGQVPTKVGLACNQLKKWDGQNADLILTIGQARRLVSRWRKSRGEYLSLPKKLKGLQISRDDSLAVGNCTTYTDKIIDELGKNTGTSDELFSFVKKNYPDQLSRVIRVINYVNKKST